MIINNHLSKLYIKYSKQRKGDHNVLIFLNENDDNITLSLIYSYQCGCMFIYLINFRIYVFYFIVFFTV